MEISELRKQYPELKSKKLVKVDIIDNGELLSSVKNSSQDFVIANHFLEHCENPILSVKNMLRVLKKGGILYMAIPDKRYTFDKDRPVTTFKHILKDYRNGPGKTRNNHFKEYIHYFLNIKDKKEAEKKINEFLDVDYSIHYHAWASSEIVELMYKLKNELNFHFELELFTINREYCELILVLKKTL